MLVSLSQARVRAGEAGAERDPTSGEVIIGAESRVQYEKGVDAWERYVIVVKADEGKVSPAAATTFANAFFTLAQNSRSYDEAFELLDDAAAAQQIAADARPSVGYLTTLAAFQMLGGDFAGGRKSGKEAEALRELQRAAQRNRRNRSTPTKNRARKSRNRRSRPKKPKKARAKNRSRTRSAASAAARRPPPDLA